MAEVAPAPDRSQRLITITVFILVIAAASIAILDWPAVRRLFGHTSWTFVLIAIGFSLLSNLSVAYEFALLYRLFGIHIKMRDIMEIDFISNALNNLITIGGLAGISVRLLMMRRHGVPATSVLAPTVFQSYLNTVGLFLLLPIGMFHLVIGGELSLGENIGIAIAASVVAAMLLGSTFGLALRPVRLWAFGILEITVHFLSRKKIGQALADFERSLTSGMTAARKKPLSLLWPIFLIAVDWGLSVLTLWWCFQAIGQPIATSTLVTGFAVGMSAALLSFIPGGLGIQEGSMTGVFTLLGVPAEKAVFASILFRFVYQVVPFAISLPFYWRHFRMTPVQQVETGAS